MKIYQFNKFTGQKEYSERIFSNSPDSNNPLKKAAGGEDIVEISLEAMEKFRKDNVLHFNKEVFENRITSIETSSDDSMDRIKASIENNTYALNSDEILLKTAEKILEQLL